MKKRIIVSLAIAIAAAVLVAHPALAATTSLTEIQTGATNTKDVVTYVGWTGALLGLVSAGLHYFKHRDDLWGTGMLVLGSLLAGFVITHAATIMGWSAQAAVFP